MSDKIDKLKKLLEVANEGLSEKRFLEAFKQVIDFVKKAKEDLTEIIIKTLNSAVSEMKAEYEALKRATEADLSDLTAKYDKSIGQALKEQENSLNFIRDKVRKIKEGKDGKDGRTPIKGVDYFDGKDIDENAIIEKLRLNPEDIRNKLEKLENNERLDKSAIKGLEEELEKLRQFRGRTLGGGGFSTIAMQQHFIFKETPTGTVNGVNTDFVLNHTPSPTNSLTVYRGGAVQTLTEDYTFSGKTITFLIAPVSGEIIRCDYLI